MADQQTSPRCARWRPLRRSCCAGGPRLLLVNGPGTCIPVCGAAFVFQARVDAGLQHVVSGHVCVCLT